MSNQAPNSDEVPPTKASEVEETATSSEPAADEETAINGIFGCQLLCSEISR